MANERISDLPAAGPILGTELVPVVQSGQTRQSTAAAIVDGAQPLGQQSLSLNATFSGTVASAPLVSNWAFGTAAPSDPTATHVSDLTTLAASFTPVQDFTQQIAIQSQIEAYQPFNVNNFAFQTDRMNILALNPNSDWAMQVTQVSTSVNLNNTATVIANLGLANTTGLRVNQLVGVQGKGLYVISAIVTNTSVTLLAIVSSPTTAATSGLIFWMNIDSAPLSVAQSTGTPTMTFAAMPTGMNGRQVAFAGSTNALNRDKDYRILTSDATTLTLDQNWTYGALANATRILFIPVVTSGQIWSIPQYDLTNPQTFFAMELSVSLLAGSATANLLGVNTMAEFNAIPTDTPWGAWPAFWMYSGADPHGVVKSQSVSEIDMFEMFNSTTANSQMVAGTNHGVTPGRNVFVKTDNGWSYSTTSTFTTGPTSTTWVGDHKYQLIFTNGKTYRFVDDILWKADTFEWDGQYAAQLACNLSVGSILPAYVSNVMFPMATTNFPAYVYGIKTIKAWYQAP